MRRSGLQERQSLEGRGALKITPVLPQSTLFLATHADSAYRLPPFLSCSPVPEAANSSPGDSLLG